MVCAAVGSVILNVVLLIASAVEPSKTIALCPATSAPGCTVPEIVTKSASASPSVTAPFKVVAPVTSRSPKTQASVVTVALLRVANPLVDKVAVPILPLLVILLVVVNPVTPRVPPTVASFVIVALLSVATPEV